MFETQSEAWKEVGLLRQIDRKVARRARYEALGLTIVFVLIAVAFDRRKSLTGATETKTVIVDGHRHQVVVAGLGGIETPAQIAIAIILLILGWAIARALGRALGPALFRRMDPATAGTAGFLIRLTTLVVAVVVALTVAGVNPQTLAVGGAVTAVILGLAAQQTLGNLIAGTVLLSARPFRVGDKVRLQGGPIGGQLEGTVSALGLLYTTFARGEDSILVPNSVVLNVAVIPLREPDSVNLRARLPRGITPSDLQHVLDEALQTPLREAAHITLEELDGDEAIVRITATPVSSSQGRKLASELQSVVMRETRAADSAP
jgi:small-conductance mechanosensitive channel